MPVNLETYEFPLSGGLDTKTDEKLVTLPSFLDIKNMVFNKHGSLTKRTGYTGVSMEDLDDTSISGLKVLANREDELVAASATKLYSYSQNQDRWIDKGDFALYQESSQRVSDLPTAQTNVSSATDGTIRVYAWANGDGDYYSVLSADGTTVLKGPTLITAGATRSQVQETESGILLSYLDTAAASISFLQFSANNPEPTSRFLLLTDLHTDNLYDFGYSVEGQLGLLAYKETGGDVRAFTVDKTGAFQEEDTTMPTTSGVERFIDVKANSKPIDVTDTAVAYGYLWSVCYGVSSATRCFVVTTDAAGLIAANDLEIGSSTAYTYATSVAVDISDGAQFWEILYTDGTDTFIRERSISSWDAAQRTFAQDVVLAAKPVRTEDFDDFSAGQDASWVVPLFYSSQLQSTVLVYNSSGNPISSFARGLASLNTTKPYPDSHRDSANALSFPVAVKQRVDVDDSQADAYTQEGIELFTLTQSGFGVDAVTAEGNLYMGGSLVWQYDGVSLAEAGFLIYPELDKSASGITVSGATLDYAVENQPFTIQRTDGGHTNTYLYYVVYEWYDHQGNRHQSAAVPITMDNMENPGTDNVTIVIPDLNVTWKSDVRAAVYRTHSDSVALAFRVPHNSGSLYPGVSLASGPFTFIDSTADDDLKAGEVLYLSSGELDHVAPVAGTALLSHDDRIFVANKDRVYFSKRSTDNTPPNFNEGLYIQVPPDGGDITGLATLDNKLVMFKRDRMYMSSGEGPNALGIGSYSIPRLIRTDAGCKDKRTIERVAQGVMFQSDKGIYWLNRGEAVNYIGAPVEAYNSDTFVASTLVPDDQIVIFLSESGRTLVYDYEHNLWTTYTDHGGLAATVINDTYYYLRSDGASVYKSYSGYLDAGSVITAEVKFPWIRPSGLQQRWHIRKAVLLGNYLSDHDLQVTVAFNYREYDAYRKSWDTSVALNNSTLGGPATLGGGDALGIGDGTKPDRVYQVGHILRDQRIMAVQLTLTEIPPETDLGASFELTGLAIEAGGYDDTFKLPGSKTI